MAKKEVDQLISRARMKMKAFLQLLKETGARPLEAWSLKWNDIDIPNRAIMLKLSTIQGVEAQNLHAILYLLVL